MIRMSDKELIQALRPMVLRDKFQCLGCGHPLTEDA